MRTIMRHGSRTIFSPLGMFLFLVSLSVPGFGQGQSQALQFLANIPVPNWATSGDNEVSVDIVTYDFQSGVVYIADHVNDGATAIDTHTWRYLGTVTPPGCGIQTKNCGPAGLVVAPDLRKLVFTGGTPPSLWIYDLRAPGAAPASVKTAAGPDLIDYDPINHYVYVKHSRLVSVVDIVNLKVVATIPIAVSSQQPRFNPVDGFIYLTLADSGGQGAGAGVAKIDPVTNTIVATYSLHNSSVTCTPNDFAIDPVTDTAFIACKESAVLMDLHNGAILNTYPQATGGDSTAVNPNLRHLYVAANANKNSNGLCSADSTKAFPSIGVVSNAPTTGQFVGVACFGRGSQIASDSVNNNVYAASIQFPVDPNSPDTGQPGVLVFHDPAPPVSGTSAAGTEVAHAQAVLSPAASSGVQGTVDFTLRRRNMSVDATLTGLPAGFRDTVLVVTTTVGNEVVNCGVDGAGKGYCGGYLVGDPLIGGVADIGSGGSLVASGPITLSATTPTYIPID